MLHGATFQRCFCYFEKTYRATVPKREYSVANMAEMVRQRHNVRERAVFQEGKPPNGYASNELNNTTL